MDPDLTALTATAATTVVQLLATAAWKQAASAVGGLWLRRLVVADPQVTDELRRVVAQLRSVLADAEPAWHTTITMQATAFDRSRVHQAARDLHVHYPGGVRRVSSGGVPNSARIPTGTPWSAAATTGPCGCGG
ncbi:MAG TPA: hypothetical protein VJT72_17685 [Pseudonocardiaceae bacterium]|nr:hypothetical protein [Pseudonocardiaceae bacterium]